MAAAVASAGWRVDVAAAVRTSRMLLLFPGLSDDSYRLPRAGRLTELRRETTSYFDTSIKRQQSCLQFTLRTNTPIKT